MYTKCQACTFYTFLKAGDGKFEVMNPPWKMNAEQYCLWYCMPGASRCTCSHCPGRLGLSPVSGMKASFGLVRMI